MSLLLSGVSRFIRRRWLYGMISALMAVSVVVMTPTPSHAQGRLLDLIFRGIQVIQLSNLSSRQEVALGRQMDQQLMSQQFRPYRNSEVNDYIDEIGQRLVPSSDRPDIPYTFRVVEDRQINAFATMGGYVYVTTGLLRAADNEAQVAGVLGHEIGHIASRHVVENMRERAIQSGVASAAGLDRSTAIAIGIELAVNRPNSREAEYEADERGLATMTRAGYAPRGMVDFMEKLRGQSSLPSILSTHPGAGDRVERLQRMIPAGTADSGAGLDNQAYRSRIRPLL